MKCRFVRAAPPVRCRITQRDVDLLVSLYEHQALSRTQLLRLGYFASVRRCNARMRRLFDAGLVSRTFLDGRSYGSEAIYAPTQKAAPVIAGSLSMETADVRSHCTRPPSPVLLRHLLATTDVELWLRSAGAGGCKLARFLPERLCYHEFDALVLGRWQTYTVKPDGYFEMIGSTGSRSYFLETDLGTVSLSRIRSKLCTYLQYQRCRAFADVYGQPSFTVCFATTCEKRLKRLLSQASEAELDIIGTTFDWLAEATVESPIWRDTQGDLQALSHGGGR